MSGSSVLRTRWPSERRTRVEPYFLRMGLSFPSTRGTLARKLVLSRHTTRRPSALMRVRLARTPLAPSSSARGGSARSRTAEPYKIVQLGASAGHFRALDTAHHGHPAPTPKPPTLTRPARLRCPPATPG